MLQKQLIFVSLCTMLHVQITTAADSFISNLTKASMATIAELGTKYIFNKVIKQQEDAVRERQNNLIAERQAELAALQEEEQQRNLQEANRNLRQELTRLNNIQAQNNLNNDARRTLIANAAQRRQDLVKHAERERLAQNLQALANLEDEADRAIQDLYSKENISFCEILSKQLFINTLHAREIQNKLNNPEWNFAASATNHLAREDLNTYITSIHGDFIKNIDDIMKDKNKIQFWRKHLL